MGVEAMGESIDGESGDGGEGVDRSAASPPTKSRKRRTALIGCGGVFLLCLLTIVVWLQDESPPDVSDLRPDPVPIAAADAPTVLAGILQLDGQLVDPLPSVVEEHELDGALPAWGPGGFDRAAWDVATVREPLAEFVRAHGEFLDQYSEVIERASLGAEPLESFNGSLPGVVEMVNAAEALFLRALHRRLDGEIAGASRDLALVLRLGDRLLTEGGVSLLHVLVGDRLIMAAWPKLAALSFDGPLDPEVEARLISRAPPLDRPRKSLSNALRHEYVVLAQTLEDHSDALGEASGFGPVGRFFFKPNRTRRIAAESFRTAIAWLDRPYPLRGEDPWVEERASIWQVILTLNIGEQFVDLWVPNMKQLATTADKCLAIERAGRILVALSVYEREHGKLPLDHASFVAEFPVLVECWVDPYTQRPFHYDPKRRLLWSAGIDGESEGATESEQLLDGTADSPFDLADPTWIIPPLW